MSTIVKKMFPTLQNLQKRISKALLPAEQPAGKTPMFGIVTDEADPHGFSIFLSAINSPYTTFVETAIVATVPDKLSAAASAVKLSGRMDAIFVTDLPVDSSSEERTKAVIEAYRKLRDSVPEETRIIFLDHHRTYQDIIDALQEAGVEVHVTNGISMTLTLRKVFEEGTIEFFGQEEAVEIAVEELGRLLADPFSCVMLAGNRADMDPSVAQLYRKIGRVEKLDYLAEGLSWLVLAMRYRLAEVPLGGICAYAEKVGRMIDEGKLPWPPKKYATVLALHGEIMGRVLLYKFDQSLIPGMWINRAVAYYLDSNDAREKGIDFVVTYGVGRPPRQVTGKAITIAAYARWYADVNLRPILLGIAEKLNKEGLGEWKVYGHPTFSIMSKYIPENTDEEEAWKEAREVAEMIAEELNKLSED